jgi:hypothetical protein
MPLSSGIAFGLKCYSCRGTRNGDGFANTGELVRSGYTRPYGHYLQRLWAGPRFVSQCWL